MKHYKINVFAQAAFFGCLAAFFGGFSTLKAQDVRITLGKTEIGINEMFQITVTVHNDRLKNYSSFPDIPGLRKAGTSSSTQTNIVNGQMSTSQGLTQNYLPEREGTFALPAFSMTVNGVKASSDGAKIKVGPAVQRRTADPFAEFWGGLNSQDQNKQFVDVKEDAFFSVNTSTDQVYVGEGFTFTIAFYVALSNRAQMSFYKIGDQLMDILKKTKPANCWEENVGIDQIDPTYVSINGKQYRQYKIYESVLFPLSAAPISIPQASLRMIKYKEAQNPTFFGKNRQEDYKDFFSKARTVKVKDLPPHPLRDMVSVGNYRLATQNNSPIQLKTGENFGYNFKIEGEGNISGILSPHVSDDGMFQVYPPNVNQQVNISNGKVHGSKTFSYFIEPQEPGEANLSDYFHWVFFNPKTSRYDTLRPQLPLLVTGESKQNAFIAANDMGGFYDLIQHEGNELVSIHRPHWLRYMAGGGLAVFLLVSLVLLVKKP